MVIVFQLQLPRFLPVSKVVKRVVTLPAHLAAEAVAIARDENRSLSSVIGDALQALVRARRREEFRELQAYWSNRAQAKGVLSQHLLLFSLVAAQKPAH
jgi:hypothetical protein